MRELLAIGASDAHSPLHLDVRCNTNLAEASQENTGEALWSASRAHSGVRSGYALPPPLAPGSGEEHEVYGARRCPCQTLTTPSPMKILDGGRLLN